MRPLASADIKREKEFQRLFDNDDNTIVIVGMSLTDPNIRRFIHRRASGNDLPSGKVYAIMKSGGGSIDRHTSRFWDDWGVAPVLLQNHHDLPRLVRDIQWGPSSPAWFEETTAWVRKRVPDPLAPAWQRGARVALVECLNYLRRYFAVRQEERLSISLFLPLPNKALEQEEAASHIFMCATTGRDRDLTRDEIWARRLKIHEHNSEGVAGQAFIGSIPLMVVDDGRGIDSHFGEAKSRDWNRGIGAHGRTWRSIYSIPVLDGPHWLPIGVITVSSNMGEPCWKRMNTAGESELKTVLRRSARSAIANTKP
jgi:hypothetical protein